MIRTDPSSDAARTRARRGAILIAAAILLSAAISVSELIVRAAIEGPRITALAHSAEGVGPGSEVWVAGKAVGRVLSVSFRPPEATRNDGSWENHVVIEAVIDRIAEPVLRADATADLRPSDLRGARRPRRESGDGVRAALELRGHATRVSSADRTGDGHGAGGHAASGGARARTRRFRGAGRARFGPWVRSRASARIGAPSPTCEAMSRRLRELLQRDLARCLARPARHGHARRPGRAARTATRFAAWADAPELASAGHGVERTAAALNVAISRLEAMTERLGRGEGTAGRALVDRAKSGASSRLSASRPRSWPKTSGTTRHAGFAYGSSSVVSQKSASHRECRGAGSRKALRRVIAALLLGGATPRRRMQRRSNGRRISATLH